MRIAVCDDDALSRQQVLRFLDEYIVRNNGILTVSVFDRATALTEAVARFGNFDIYLLDILMPGMNGIQLGLQLRRSDSEGKILYLTSGPEFAYESYQVQAFDYLLKPVDKERLFASLDRALRAIGNRKEKSFIIKTRENSLRLTLDEILYAELVDRRVAYRTVSGQTAESISIRTNFAESVQDLLNDGRFVLCGSGIAVNLYHITVIDNETLIFKNGTKLHIGKRAVRDLRSLWSDFWLSEEGDK